ncbi:MAG TPA: winged helix-turn-helix domain-containing protein [Steroidobacteraceae bacterium]|nr:winged helix-turn-helix domain-containing protein [Steroidobacteraceae bacterium]
MAPQAGTTNIRDLTPDPAGYQVDDLIIDLAPRRVRRAGTVIPLKALSFDLLVALVRAAPNLLSFDQLSERVWPGLVVTPETIVQRVKLLRGALGDDPHTPRYIEGVRGRGYRMVAEVRPLTESHGTPETIVPPSLIETKGEASPNVHAGIAAAEAAPVSPPSATSPAPRRAAEWVPLGWIGGALIVLAVLAGSWAMSHYRGGSKPAEQTSALVSPVIRSLVVLPLENLSADKEQEYFADGMTDALTTDLAQIGSLRIISRTSAMHFKGSKETLPQIGRDLQVDAVVEGTVARAEGRVRVTAQLIQASSDQHLWARTYERDLKDVLALQDEIARDITEQIRVKLTPKERGLLIQVHPVDPEAYDAYLRGRYWWDKGGAGAWKALDYFQKAIAKDPSYALAYAGVADSYFILGSGNLSPKEAYPKGKEAAIKALELDPSLAEAHASMASIKFYGDWDWSGAVDEIRQAIALNPNDASAHRRYADLLGAVGRFDEALEETERGRDLDPFSFASNAELAGMLDGARRYDDALHQIQRVLEMFPDCFDCYNEIADIYEHQRMFAEAFAARQQALSMQKDPTVGALAEAYKRGGYRGWLLKRIETLEQAPPQTIQLRNADSHLEMNKAFGIAYFYTLLNDEAHAMHYLERAYDGRNPAVLFLQVSPLWDPIRASPRFRDLVRRIGVPQPKDDKN